jgi:hypothetical protein
MSAGLAESFVESTALPDQSEHNLRIRFVRFISCAGPVRAKDFGGVQHPGPELQFAANHARGQANRGTLTRQHGRKFLTITPPPPRGIQP